MKVDTVKLKLLAAEAGLTVLGLSEASGVAFTTVVKARGGKPVSERTIVKLAKALNVNPREIMQE